MDSLSIARKLYPVKIKQTINDWFVMYRSKKKMAKHLTVRAIRYVVGAAQERHEYVCGGSSNRCNLNTCKEILGEILRY